MAGMFYQGNRTPNEEIDISKVKVVILEEPTSDGCRFPYENEHGSSSCIKGANSTEKNPTYPTIKIENYFGSVLVVVSLITINGQHGRYFPHPHKLIGESCRNGAFYKKFKNSENICRFKDLIIQCVPRDAILDSLRERLEGGVDPYRTEIPGQSFLEKLHYNAVRLCFQVFLLSSDKKQRIPLHPVKSTVIYDSKSIPDLSFIRLSPFEAPVNDGEELTLLCSPLNNGKFFQANRTPNEEIDISKIKVVILEQPMSDGCRFRYKNEKRLPGPIKGVNSTEENPTYPTFKIENYVGPALIVISPITINAPDDRYFPHAHKLIGKSCRHGAFYGYINSPEMIFCCSDLRIQCAKRDDVAGSLKERLKGNIDPYGTGFHNITVLDKSNCNAVRLCFQVILPNSKGKYCIPLRPVKSAVIYDNKTVPKLDIVKLSHDFAPVSGGQEIICLCSPINSDDVEIVFIENNGKEKPWEFSRKLSLQNIYQKVAIVIETPAYENTDIQKDVNCFIYLRQGDKNGKPVRFTLKKEDTEGLDHKKPKLEASRLDRVLQSGNLCSDTSRGVNLRTIKKAVRNRTYKRNNDVNLRIKKKAIRKVVDKENGPNKTFHPECAAAEMVFDPPPPIAVIRNESQTTFTGIRDISSNINHDTTISLQNTLTNNQNFQGSLSGNTPNMINNLSGNLYSNNINPNNFPERSIRDILWPIISFRSTCNATVDQPMAHQETVALAEGSSAHVPVNDKQPFISMCGESIRHPMSFQESIVSRKCNENLSDGNRTQIPVNEFRKQSFCSTDGESTCTLMSFEENGVAVESHSAHALVNNSQEQSFESMDGIINHSMPFQETVALSEASSVNTSINNNLRQSSISVGEESNDNRMSFQENVTSKKILENLSDCNNAQIPVNKRLEHFFCSMSKKHPMPFQKIGELLEDNSTHSSVNYNPKLSFISVGRENDNHRMSFQENVASRKYQENVSDGNNAHIPVDESREQSSHSLVGKCDCHPTPVQENVEVIEGLSCKALPKASQKQSFGSIDETSNHSKSFKENIKLSEDSSTQAPANDSNSSLSIGIELDSDEIRFLVAGLSLTSISV